MASLYRGWVSGLSTQGIVRAKVDYDSCKRRLKLTKAARLEQDAVGPLDVSGDRIILQVDPEDADSDLPAGLYLLNEKGSDPEVSSVMLTCHDVHAF